MEKLPFLILVLNLVGCASIAEKSTQNKAVHLGQTQYQIKKELGPPASHYMNGFDLFHDSQGNEVQAHFQAGKADSLFYYTFKKNIAEPWLSSVLNLNSNGTPWVLEESSTSGRRVYRSQDRKFHAFVSRGNQEMVDTDAFFQKALHQPSKTILVDDLPECIFRPDHAGAVLGDAEAKISKDYGQPIASMKDGAKNYFDGCEEVIVHYNHGICDSVCYFAGNHKKLTDCWISGELYDNSKGKAWVVNAKSEPPKVWYQTLKGEFHAASDGEGLSVETDSRFRELRQSTGKKTPPNHSILCVLHPCADVWLGQTEQEMNKFLGMPKIEKDKGVSIYKDGTVQVRATFDDGVCGRIVYVSENGKKFTDHWVSATLALNSGGYAWFVHENSNPKRTYYNTFNKKFYARLQDGKNLGVMTEKLYLKSLHEVESGEIKNSK
jgi:hypothetical protein